MSEKRFSVGIRRKDNEVFYSFFDGDNPLDLDNIVDLLNEQQATISQLQDLCGKSDYKNAKLRIENKKLKEMNEQLKADEQLYAKEILRLKEELKEKEIVKLGGDY